jgi:hypothetical protein
MAVKIACTATDSNHTEEVLVDFDGEGKPTQVCGCAYLRTKQEINSDDSENKKYEFGGQSNVDAYCINQTERVDKCEGCEKKEKCSEEDDSEDEECKRKDVVTIYPCVFAEGWKPLFK